MSQQALTIPASPLTMATLKTTLEAIFAAINTVQSGTAAPASAVEPSLWIDTAATPVYILKMYTTTAGWISLVSVNITTGAVSFYRTGGTALASAFALTILDDADAAAVLVTLGIAAATLTFTNKRITARVTTIVSHATPTINTDICDCVTITAQAEAITSMTTNLSGTPLNFDKLLFRIKDDGTARAITWGDSFQSGSATMPTITVLGKTLTVLFIRDAVDGKWTCEATGSRA